MTLNKSMKNFSDALAELIKAIVEEYIEGKTDKVLGKKRKGVASNWPKNFSVFYKNLSDTDKSNSYGQVLKDSSCTSWTPEKVTLLIAPNTDTANEGLNEDDINDIRDLLKSELDFSGDLDVSIAQAGKPTKGKAKKETTESEITIDDIKQECAALAKKLGNKQIVMEILKQHGGKVKDIPESEYPALYNALKNYGETTTSEGDDEF